MSFGTSIKPNITESTIKIVEVMQVFFRLNLRNIVKIVMILYSSSTAVTRYSFKDEINRTDSTVTVHSLF